jgi:predicted permease
LAFNTVLHQVVIMFLLMLVGYIIFKIGMISEETAKGMTQLLLLIVTPCVIFISFQLEYSVSLVHGLLICAASAIFVHLFSIILGHILFRSHPRSYQQRIVLRFAIIYSNCGFMGIPLLAAVIHPSELGVFYASVYIAIFSFFVWTHGVILYKSSLKFSSGEATRKTGLVKNIIETIKSLKNIRPNPNIIAVAVGLIFFFLSIKVPVVIYDTMKYIYYLNTPIAMIIIGCRLAQVNLRTIFSEKWIWPGVIIKNLLIPLVAIFVLHLAGISGVLLLACLLPIACPAAGNTVLMADMYGIDTKFPAKIMSVSTLLTIVTIPLLVYIVTIMKY